MSLTVGTGPFGHHPAGAFTKEMPARDGLMYFEDHPKRIRARFADETVLDSRGVKMLHEHGRLPVYYFPAADLREDLLEESDYTRSDPTKGEASYWSVRVGDRVAENAVWSYLEPVEGALALRGYRQIDWHSMDEWLEEDEVAIVHARDPYHRIDILETSRHIVVSLDGERLAETRHAKALFETGLPIRWYIPREDVRSELLAESETRTGCAYKGFASYWDVRVGNAREDDLVWTYFEPRPEAQRIQGMLAFMNERVDLVIDGEPQERPTTQWSKPRGWRREGS